MEEPTLTQFNKKMAAFQAWLIANGSEVFPTTNTYEIARFSTPEGTGLIHRNEAGRISSWQHGAKEAYFAFIGAKPWHASGSRPARRSKSDRVVLALIERDGSTCMYCGVPMAPAEITLEHIVPVTHGGPNHMANLALAHKLCNSTAGHLPARVKLEMAIRRRAAP